jgi:DNA repair protein RAD50
VSCSTRYTKALEAFRKKEKELTSKCKDIKVDLAGLQSTMTAVEGYRRDLREQQDEEERISGEKDEITKQIEEADKEIEYYTGIVLEISKAQSQLQQIQSRANEHKAALDRQQKMVEEDMSTKHTMQDLRSMLDGFDAKVRSQKAGQETLEIEIEDINREIDTLHKSEMDAKLKLGKLESERDAYEYNLKERIRVMETIATAYNVDLQELTQTQNTNASFHGSLHAASQSVDTQQLAEISAEDMQSFFRKIETIRGQLTDELSKHKQRVQQEEDQLQKVLIDLGGKLSALEKGKCRRCARTLYVSAVIRSQSL